MKCGSIDVGMAMANYTATVHVTGLGRLKIRMWLFARIVWLACWIGGCGFKVEREDDA